MYTVAIDIYEYQQDLVVEVDINEYSFDLVVELDITNSNNFSQNKDCVVTQTGIGQRTNKDKINGY